MKQVFKLSLFTVCLIGFNLQPISAAAEFQKNPRIERQGMFYKNMLLIDKKERVGKQGVKVASKKKNRKKFKEVFKNTNADKIRRLSRLTLALGILALSASVLAWFSGIYLVVVLAWLLIISGITLGIISLVQINKSGEARKTDKILSKIGLILSSLPVVFVAILFVLLSIFWVA